jgi:hypothetical protein
MSKDNIGEKYKKLFDYVNLIEPPKGFEAQILNFVIARERRLTRFRAWAFGSSSLASFGLSLWTAVYLVKSASETGLWQYMSLAFSENGVLLAYWREFSLSIIESLPIVSIIIFLATVGVFVWSFANVIKKDTGKFIMSFN